jgi:hypothetical protein
VGDLSRDIKYCQAACALAINVQCEKMAEACKYDSARNIVNVGPYVLPCKPACAAACAGPDTGQTMCVEQCIAWPHSPNVKTSANGLPPDVSDSGAVDVSASPPPPPESMPLEPTAPESTPSLPDPGIDPGTGEQLYRSSAKAAGHTAAQRVSLHARNAADAIPTVAPVTSHAR